ncbi:MAG TPA: response regulator transcription factor [Candidatus Eremiobacteraceae bacterium]|jgi:DNA-binding response OmpR family regulator
MRSGSDQKLRKILVVDDEPQIVEILEKYLTDEGFVVCSACDGAQAVELQQTELPDLIVLDLKMPGKHGFEAFREIRSRSDVPIIMLTSRGDEVDRVVGLELGADDYIAKPFSPREVVARVKTVLRRAGDGASMRRSPSEPGPPMRIGDIELDSAEHEVRRGGQSVHLTPTEFRILEVLFTSPGRAFTRTQLLDQVKGDDLEIFDRTLDRHIANLRHKIEEDATKPRYVVTVFGVGYKLSKHP